MEGAGGFFLPPVLTNGWIGKWYGSSQTKQGEPKKFLPKEVLIGVVKLIPDGFHKRIAADFFVLGNEGRTV